MHTMPSGPSPELTNWLARIEQRFNALETQIESVHSLIQGFLMAEPVVPGEVDKRKRIARMVIEACAERFFCRSQDILSPNRSEPIATARAVAFYILHGRFGYSSRVTAIITSGCHPSTVRHAMARVACGVESTPALAAQIEDIIAGLSEYTEPKSHDRETAQVVPA